MKQIKLSNVKVTLAKMRIDPKDILIIGVPDNGYGDEDIQVFIDGINEWKKKAKLKNEILIVTAVNGIAIFDDKDMSAHGWIRKPHDSNS